MIPVVAILAAARIAAYAINSGSGSGQSPRGSGGGGRPADPDNQSGWIALAWFIVAPLQLGLAVALSEGVFGVLPFMIALSIPLFPWWWARRVFIPLGWYRWAYYVTHLAQVKWNGDGRGAKCAAAAWALLRKREVKPEQVEWIERKLLKHSWRPVKGSTVLAHALLAARTNPEDARRLMTSIDWLGPSVARWSTRALATEWLACDAAERGDWEAAAKLGARRSPKTWASLFLIDVARRFTRQDPPFDFIVCTMWALAPRRPWTWRILREALAVPRAVAPEQRVPDHVDVRGLTPVQAAIRRHVSMLGMPPRELTAARLLTLWLAWEEAFSSASASTATAQNAALQPVPELPPSAREQIVEDLTQLVRASPAPHAALAGGGGILDEALRRCRDGLLSDMQLACDRLKARVSAKRALPTIDEWREVVALRLAWENAVARGGEELRRVGFSSLHFSANSLAVWLFNERSERPLANAIHTWLAAEAKRAGDSEAEALETKNSRIKFE